MSQQDVADRAGVEVEYVGKLVGLGVLDPTEDGAFSEGDVRRARLYQGRPWSSSRRGDRP